MTQEVIALKPKTKMASPLKEARLENDSTGKSVKPDVSLQLGARGADVEPD
ncbi:MAG: hypothetical protein AAGF01_25950 [Cyanobacteria bacterium P01_G01_bin.38]